MCLLVLGVLGIVWGVGWFFTTYDTPAVHPRIEAAERDYIERALDTKGAKVHRAKLIII